MKYPQTIRHLLVAALLLQLQAWATAQNICKITIDGQAVEMPEICGHNRLDVKLFMQNAQDVTSAEVDAPGFITSILSYSGESTGACNGTVVVRFNISASRPDGVREVTLFKRNSAGGRTRISAFKINVRPAPVITSFRVQNQDGSPATTVFSGRPYLLTIIGNRLHEMNIKTSNVVSACDLAQSGGESIKGYNIVFQSREELPVFELATDSYIVYGDGNAQKSSISLPSVLRIVPAPVFAPETEQWTEGPYFGQELNAFADVDGDKKADAIVVNYANVVVRRSDGTAFTPNENWTTNPYYGDKGTFFADVTGDGKADAVVSNWLTPVVVRRSTGTAFSANENWTEAPYFGARGTFLADVTGDGKADLIKINNDKTTVRRSDGTKFLAEEVWTSNPYFGTKGTFFADVTGDGRADAIVVNDDGVTVRRSSGSRFLANERWTTNPYFGSKGTFFADVDGDRLADAIVVNNQGITIRRSTGSAFSPNSVGTYDAYFGEKGTFFADILGGAKVSAIVINSSGTYTRPPFFRF